MPCWDSAFWWHARKGRCLGTARHRPGKRRPPPRRPPTPRRPGRTSPLPTHAPPTRTARLACTPRLAAAAARTAVTTTWSPRRARRRVSATTRRGAGWCDVSRTIARRSRRRTRCAASLVAWTRGTPACACRAGTAEKERLRPARPASLRAPTGSGFVSPSSHALVAHARSKASRTRLRRSGCRPRSFGRLRGPSLRRGNSSSIAGIPARSCPSAPFGCRSFAGKWRSGRCRLPSP